MYIWTTKLPTSKRAVPITQTIDLCSQPTCLEKATLIMKENELTVIGAPSMSRETWYELAKGLTLSWPTMLNSSLVGCDVVDWIYQEYSRIVHKSENTLERGIENGN